MGKNCAEKNEEDGGAVAHAEEDDRDRNPGDGADGAQNLHHRIHHLVGRRIPAQRQAQRNADHHRGAEAKRHAAQRIDDVAPQHMLPQQLADSLLHFARRGKTLVAVQTTE